ncbi:MAG: hypothetical protein CGW95_03835 [Phenylobacterium zucineum]|nr:MAG: hypothetical protein CGW95_03835 [Phenylobacterium zucineum]
MKDPTCSEVWQNPDWKKQNVLLCAGQPQVMQVLTDWNNFTSEEQLRRIKTNAGPIYVTQQPDNKYVCPERGLYEYTVNGHNKTQELNYHSESFQTNKALFSYPEDDAFLDGYKAGKKILDNYRKNAEKISHNYFKAELRREYFQPAIAEIWQTWYGLPDGKTLLPESWSWKRIVDVISQTDPATVARTHAVCPGDFMAPSRGSVFPRPSEAIRDFAQMHGKAILKAGREFVALHRTNVNLPKTRLIAQLFKVTSDDEVLARNIIGTMIGAIPPMDANLRNILFEWIDTGRLWRHQAAFKTALKGKTVEGNLAGAMDSLRTPVSQAMCLRPAPDMLFRTAKRTTRIARSKGNDISSKLDGAWTHEGDMVLVSLVSASQQSLHNDPTGRSGIDVIFGGKRVAVPQGYELKDGKDKPGQNPNSNLPVHACPAQKWLWAG